MKKGAILFFMLLLLTVTVSAQEEGPAAISPGNDMGVAVVGQSTPTFSWTAVDWATTYRVEVFIAPEGQVLPYKEMTVQSYPLLVKEIRGAATAWTPSAEEQLSNEGVYVWYVQAMNDMGTAVWSEGKPFAVNLAAAFAPLEEAVSDSLKENGVSQDIIEDVLSDVKTKVGEQATAVGIDNPIPISVQGTEGLYITKYGNQAGLSTTTTYAYDTFIGTHAGQANTTGTYNTYLGHRAGELGSTGGNNTILGSLAGYNNSANYSVFVGMYSGYANTSGTYNTFVGYSAGDSNTTANYNSFYGYYAGQANTTGHSNSIFGTYAGYLNSTGYENVFQGRETGYSNNTGYRNTFVGAYAGRANTIADYNVFIGYRAGYSNSGGSYNTFVGDGAGYFNTAHYNTFVGRQAGYANTSGTYNLFFGYQAGRNNTTAFYNTAVGYQAGYSTNTGGTNVYLGYRAGYTNATGTGNVFLGHRAGEDFTGSNKLFIDNSDTNFPLIWGDFGTNTVAFIGTVGIGTKAPSFPMEMKKTGTNASIVVDRTDGATNYINATATSGNFGTVTNHVLRLVVNSEWKMRLHTDNSLTLRNGASCSTGGTWTNSSSRELKENIHELSSDDAFATLENLNPVQYNYKTDKEEDYIGFIAEDVPDLVATKDKKGMATMDVVAVLTKVVQEQQKTANEQQDLVASQQKVMEELQKVNQNLQKRLEELENKNKDR